METLHTILYAYAIYWWDSNTHAVIHVFVIVGTSSSISEMSKPELQNVVSQPAWRYSSWVVSYLCSGSWKYVTLNQSCLHSHTIATHAMSPSCNLASARCQCTSCIHYCNLRLSHTYWWSVDLRWPLRVVRRLYTTFNSWRSVAIILLFQRAGTPGGWLGSLCVQQYDGRYMWEVLVGGRDIIINLRSTDVVLIRWKYHNSLLVTVPVQ